MENKVLKYSIDSESVKSEISSLPAGGIYTFQPIAGDEKFIGMPFIVEKKEEIYDNLGDVITITNDEPLIIKNEFSSSRIAGFLELESLRKNQLNKKRDI